MQAIYAFVLSLSVATVLISALIRVADALAMTDLGGGRKVHDGVTPCTGGVATVSGSLASAILRLPPRPDRSALVGAAALLFAGIHRFEGHRARLLGRGEDTRPLSGLSGYLRRSRLLARGPYITANVLLPPLLAFGALIVPETQRDIALLAAALLVVLLIALTIKSVPALTEQRLAAYVTAVTLVYLLNKDDWLRDLCVYCGPVLFGGLAVSVLVWICFSTQRFALNSQDILLLLIAIAIPSLPDLKFQHLGLVALESLVAFYAIELLLEGPKRQWDPLRIGLIVALGALTVRGYAF